MHRLFLIRLVMMHSSTTQYVHVIDDTATLQQCTIRKRSNAKVRCDVCWYCRRCMMRREKHRGGPHAKRQTKNEACAAPGRSDRISSLTPTRQRPRHRTEGTQNHAQRTGQMPAPATVVIIRHPEAAVAPAACRGFIISSPPSPHRL